MEGEGTVPGAAAEGNHDHQSLRLKQACHQDHKIVQDLLLRTVGKSGYVSNSNLKHRSITLDGITGGLLGLFTGISILSMFEVIFWIARIFGDSLSFGPWKRRRVG